MAATDAFRTLYLQAPIPLVTLRDDGRVVDANPAFVEATRSPRETLLDADFGDSLAAQDRGASRVYLRQALERGTADWSVSLSGAPNVRWRVKAMSFKGQVAVLAFWTPPEQDVARTLVPALAAVARRIPEQALILLSADLWVLGAWGLPEVGAADDAEVVGRHLRGLVDVDPALLKELAEAMRAEEPWAGRLTLSDDDLGRGECSAALVPSRVVGGSRQGAGFLVLRRVADDGRPPQDHRRLHRMARVGDFAVELVDGLRDRVRALVRSEPGSREARRLGLEFEALDQRLRQFTDIARIEGRVALADVADGLRNRWADFLADQGVEFTVSVDDGVGPEVLGVSEDVMVAVLDELVENARVALDDAPLRTIAVTLGAGDGSALLAVEDSGPGVPGSRRQAVFRPFASGRAGRLGLGLATARSQLELVGGSLTLEESGSGARFLVRVPTVGSSPGPPAPSDGLRSPVLSGRSVLVVDEAEDTRRALARILATVGMTVREAWSARSAVSELVQRGVADAVVCTVGGDESGAARFVSDLREVAPELVARTVLLVDVASPTRIGVLEQRWGCAVLARPLVVEQLVERLERGARA